MGKEENLKAGLFSSIIQYVRANHADAIDKAYEFFWDEYVPDEFLVGTALSLGFVNFEDWLVCDYKANDDKETFIDIYMKSGTDLDDKERSLLKTLKDSIISLYEVTSVARDKRVLLRDLLMDGEFELRDKALTRGLKKGDVFATRLLPLDGRTVMSGCVYPYSAEDRKKVLNFIDRQFKRYTRNVNSAGTMRDYLKAYGDVFNLAWINLILGVQQDMG